MSPQETVDDLLQHNLLVELAHYIRRGRRFANLPTDEAMAQWVAARSFLRDGQALEMDDLGAELRLRGRAPPEALIADEVAAAAAHIRVAAVYGGSVADLSDYIAARGKPLH